MWNKENFIDKGSIDLYYYDNDEDECINLFKDEVLGF